MRYLLLILTACGLAFGQSAIVFTGQAGSIPFQPRGYLPATADPATCIPGVSLDVFRTDLGARKYCSATNTWTQYGAGSSGGSVFTGSTAVTSAFSATPTFSLADVSVKSPILFQPAIMTGNVTSVTFTNLSAGARFSILWLSASSGGPFTVTYGASVSSTYPACQVSATASGWTLQAFQVLADGTTVAGAGCIGSDQGIQLPGSTSGFTQVVASAVASGVITIPAATDTLVGKATTDTLTNKTYDTAGTGNSFKINGTAITAVSGTGAVCLATGSACSGGGNPAAVCSGIGTPTSTVTPYDTILTCSVTGGLTTNGDILDIPINIYHTPGSVDWQVILTVNGTTIATMRDPGTGTDPGGRMMLRLTRTGASAEKFSCVYTRGNGGVSNCDSQGSASGLNSLIFSSGTIAVSSTFTITLQGYFLSAISGDVLNADWSVVKYAHI